MALFLLLCAGSTDTHRQEDIMKRKSARGSAGQADTDRSQAKKNLPRRPQVKDLSVPRGAAAAIKGGAPKVPDPS